MPDAAPSSADAPVAAAAPPAPLEVLETALREVFSSVMSLIDEEDAVLLYRCTRIAEASPLLLESMDQRRASLEVLTDGTPRLRGLFAPVRYRVAYGSTYPWTYHILTVVLCTFLYSTLPEPPMYQIE